MATPQSVAFHTLGCKLNFSETSSIAQSFEDQGFMINDYRDGADIFVLNTCSVTDFADKKCRKVIRSVLNTNPETKVVVIGCYAQLKPEEILNIPGVDLVLGASEKFNVHEYIDAISKSGGKGMIKTSDIQTVDHFNASFSFGDRTRSFLKIQDGCDYKCSFCTIPKARGRSRSNTIENTIKQCEEIAQKGIVEVVLTGVNIGDFGKLSGRDESFLDLIMALDKIEDIERFRISSIEPNLCSDEIIEFVAQSKHFVPHFHMPLQSGSDSILKLMRRRYRTDLYKSRVEKIKRLMPFACIGVDVIVGFPGETEDAFQNTVDFIRDLDVSYLHVFTYSERNHTLAAEMPDSVPMQIRRERNHQLRILSEKKKHHFYKEHLQQSRPVLFEKSTDPVRMTGFTDNYIKITSPLIPEYLNTIQQVELQEIAPSGLVKIESMDCSPIF